MGIQTQREFRSGDGHDSDGPTSGQHALCRVLLVLTACCFIVALYFVWHTDELMTSTGTLSFNQSEVVNALVMNQTCAISVFDNHDLWHIFSAIAFGGCAVV